MQTENFTPPVLAGTESTAELGKKLQQYEEAYAQVEANEGPYSRKAMTLHNVISGVQNRLDQQDWGAI